MSDTLYELNDAIGAWAAQYPGETYDERLNLATHAAFAAITGRDVVVCIRTSMASELREWLSVREAIVRQPELKLADLEALEHSNDDAAELLAQIVLLLGDPL